MNQSLENSIVDVLGENLTDDKMKVFGRTEYMTSIIFNGNKSDIGKIVKVRIKESNRNSLFGEIVSNSNQKVADLHLILNKKMIKKIMKNFR